MMGRILVWFSCGAASAVALKVAREKFGSQCQGVYCDTLQSEHPDNLRFLADVEKWTESEIEIVRSSKYASIDEVFERARYMAGIAGARCTTEMKKLPREAFQQETDTHVFGYTAGEEKRAETFERNNPALHVDWVLIDAGIDKAECLRQVSAAGIRLPAMYGLGFDHNNCIGCVKATSAGYWNKTRRLFPEVFERRSRQSRAIGARLVRIRGTRAFLDELPPEESAPDDDIECGPVCQTPGIAGVS